MILKSDNSEEVIAVDTTGDWIILSIEIKTLLFWFFAVNTWLVPRPTEVKSNTFGTTAKASLEEAATFMLKSLTLTA